MYSKQWQHRYIHLFCKLSYVMYILQINPNNKDFSKNFLISMICILCTTCLND